MQTSEQPSQMNRWVCSVENHRGQSPSGVAWLHSPNPSVWLPAISPGACRQILWVGRRAALLQAGFPAGHRRTDRQALAGGEGQAGRGAAPLSLVDRPRPGTAGGLLEEKPSAAHTKPWGDGCHLGRALHLLQIATRAPVASLRPPLCTCGG